MLRLQNIFLYVFISLFSGVTFANICLSPLQIAQIRASAKKNSLGGKLKRKKKSLKDLKEDIEDLRDDKIKEAISGLSNAFKGDNADTIAERIASYMEEKQKPADWVDICENTDADADFIDCESWQKDQSQIKKYFGSQGYVKDKICEADFIDSEKGKALCEDNLEWLEVLYKNIEEYEELEDEFKDDIKELEKQQSRKKLAEIRRKHGLDSDDDTEAGNLDCPECAYIEKLRELNKPTTGQIIGNSLLAVAGVGLSVYGVREARRSQDSANELLALQGLPSESNFGHSLAGASLGFPFISRAMYGLSRGNMSAGGYACSQSGNYGGQYGVGYPNSYGPPIYGQGVINGQLGLVPYGAFPGGGIQGRFNLGGGAFPGAYGAFPGGGAYGAFPGGGIQGRFNLGGGAFPGAYGAFPGGGAYGAFPGGGIQGRFNLGGGAFPGGGAYGAFPGGGAYGAFPGGGIQGRFNLGGGAFPGAFPGGGAYGAYGGGGGFNPYLQRQQQQAQFQQQYAQQQYAQQQAQLQAQITAQKAWIAQQESAQKDWVRKQEIIGGLTQELYRIQSQIQSVSLGLNGAGGVTAGVTTGGAGSLNTGGGATISVGGNINTNHVPGSQAPNHNPAPTTSAPTLDGDLPVVTDPTHR